ncbi:MAG TPA: ribbon-helix-helix domain-containing protein [Aestuariivirgaceae bacterium]|nr:ribbon-helix-helix domain-containing protein [Aestuariivirgaceae bacterium]
MSRPVKRSVRIAGHRTSLSVEPQFWDALAAIARRRRTSLAAIVAEVDSRRGDTNLSSAVRLYVLEETRNR